MLRRHDDRRSSAPVQGPSAEHGAPWLARTHHLATRRLTVPAIAHGLPQPGSPHLPSSATHTFVMPPSRNLALSRRAYPPLAGLCLSSLSVVCFLVPVPVHSRAPLSAYVSDACAVCLCALCAGVRGGALGLILHSCSDSRRRLGVWCALVSFYSRIRERPNSGLDVDNFGKKRFSAFWRNMA